MTNFYIKDSNEEGFIGSRAIMAQRANLRALASPGSLSILITMLRHNMAAIAEIGGFRIHFALFVFCSELVGLSSRNSSRYGQERNILRLFQRWRWQSGLNGWKC